MPYNDDVILSKRLSKILRHQAEEEGLKITKEGFVRITDILEHRFFKGKYTIEDIKRVVAANDKQRFTLRITNGDLEICANQGHSLKNITKLALIPLNQTQTFDVIHGTYFKNWHIIKIQGLSRMRRNHIHFAKGLPTNDNVISGMRKDCQVYIYINLHLAIAEGLEFFMSVNEVVLSPGDEHGLIKPRYFLKVCSSNGQKLI